MILTFDEIKANAKANYKPEPKVEFSYEEPKFISEDVIVGAVAFFVGTIFLYNLIF